MEDETTLLQVQNTVSGAFIGFLTILIPLIVIL